MRTRVVFAAVLVAALAGCGGSARHGGASTDKQSPAGFVATVHGNSLGDFVFHVGRRVRIAHARAGDTVECVGRGDTIQLQVPAATTGANAYGMTADSKLSLTIGPANPGSPTHHGGLIASCTAG